MRLSRIPLTWVIVVGFNALAVGGGVAIYQLIRASTNSLFEETDRAAHEEKAKLIAKSIRQSVLTNDNVGIRSVFQNALDDPSIRLIRFLPADQREGICVARSNECYTKIKNAYSLTTADLFFASEQKLGTLAIWFENIQAVRLHQIISRYIAAAVFFILLFVNLLLAGVIQAFRKQVSWSIETVKRIASNQYIELKKSIFIEQQEFASAAAELSRVLSEYRLKIEKSAQQQVLVTIARQVAHNIRSPLLALEIGIGSLAKDLPEEKRLMLRNATARIKDIAHTLLETSRNQAASAPFALTKDQGVYLLSSLVETLVSEKRLQFRSRIGIQIQTDLGKESYGLFAKVDATEFRSLLSNLINNSVEAIEKSGIVTVRLRSEGSQLVLSVTDTGRGIPPDILPQLGQSGATFGKPAGNGLGLFHARQWLEHWGGQLSIRSELGTGTTVECRLPKAQPPAWFVPEIRVLRGSTVVILDDDSSVHQIWKGRFESSKGHDHGITLLHMSSTAEVIRWHREKPSTPTLYLIDYELLGDSQTGLELIEQLHIAAEAILVTSRYEEKQMREEAERLQVRLIPKGLVGFVPIVYEDAPLSVSPAAPSRSEASLAIDAVLIDDDPLVRRSWEWSAQAHQKRLKTFASAQEFLDHAQQIDRSTPLYIDVQLGSEPSGEQLARTAHQLGFTQISLCTGLDPETFDLKALPWIRSVVGKDPPWKKPLV